MGSSSLPGATVVGDVIGVVVVVREDEEEEEDTAAGAEPPEGVEEDLVLGL